MFLHVVAFLGSFIISVAWLYSGYMDFVDGTDLMDNSTRRNMPVEIFGVKIDNIDQSPDQ